MLVVFVDKKSGSVLGDVKASSKLLEDDGVKVIIVGVGGEVDKAEIDAVSSTSLLTNTTDSPDSTAEKIIMIADKGDDPNSLVNARISSSSSSSSLFKLG